MVVKPFSHLGVLGVRGGLYVKFLTCEVSKRFWVGARSQPMVAWNRGLRLVLSHIGEFHKKDLWICS
jgi:hypothetical protein